MFYFIICFVLLLNYASAQSNINSETNDDCICVRYYLCRKSDRTIIVDGQGIIQPRLKTGDPCGNKTTCCKLVWETTPKPIPELKSSTDRGCGFRNPDGVGFKKVATEEQGRTELGEFPWMVAILKEDGGYRCGGTLIHPSVVLTAAHCVIPNEKFLLRAGEWDSSNTGEVLQHQDRQVASIKIHEGYRPGIYYHDVALIFLRSPFKLQSHINVACLAPKTAVVDNSRCFVTGWGQDVFGVDGTVPPILKEIDLPMVPRTTCESNLRNTRLGKSFNLHRSFVCAGGEEGKDACVGDGGGPLVCPIDGQEERYQQVGIVSWGIECNKKDVPGVYASVAYLRDWIDKQIRAKNFVTTQYEY